MSFFPRIGPWSSDNFSSSEGAIFSDPTKQGITGGYVSLLPQVENTYTYIGTWEAFSGWSLSNNLTSRRGITGSFYIRGREENYPPPVSGYQKSIVSAGAWEIYTPMPVYTGGVWSGATSQHLALDGTSPYSNYSIYFEEGGGDTFTLEVDVASLYNPHTSFQGFITGQENQTGLSGLTGVVGHGIYIRTLSNWDYLEILPEGIRSITHPEVAIPLDFRTPRRIRVGVQNQDLYIIAEDGQSIAGLGKFDNTSSSSNSSLIVGAPYITGGDTDFSGVYVSGFAGHTFWSNFKLVTGSLVLQRAPQAQQYYPTSSTYMYTDTFDPTIGISNYVSAVVGFIPYSGGITTIEAQYSGSSGFTSAGISVSLDGSQKSPYSMDLSNVPVYSYPRSLTGLQGVTNPIRFKITQSSSNGRFPPPSVDSITVLASSEKSYLDLVPDWKPINRPIRVTANIASGSFLLDDPVSDIWTNLLINVPDLVGRATGDALSDSSRDPLTVSINGEGEIQYGGPYGYCFQNYIYTSGVATQGSEASNILGTSYIYNFYPDPFFSAPFKSVDNEANYITGKLHGVIGKYTYIPPAYTGRAVVYYDAISVSRPELEASANQVALISNLPTSDFGYTQQVRVVASAYSGIHDGSVGIEARVPSGIRTTDMTVGLDLQIPVGSGIYIYVTGAGINSNWTLPANDFRVYRKVELPVRSIVDGTIHVGFVVPSGYPLSQETIYNIDNLSVYPIAGASISATGLYGYIHNTGVVSQYVQDIPPIDRACTLFNTHIYLHSYPAGTGTLVRVTNDSDSRGLFVGINHSGYIEGWADFDSRSFADSDILPFTYNIGRSYFHSKHPVPLGRWTSIGFNHQVTTYDKLGLVGYSGSNDTTHFASCNKMFVTIDGYPTCSVDPTSGWLYQHNTRDADSINTPVATYIPINQSGSMLLMSDLLVKVDAIRLATPPYSDTESSLSIRGSRVTAPYLLPDVLCNGTAIDNALVYTGLSTSLGSDIYIGSCYNFCGPGYTYWDHGPWGNHLVPFGTPLSDSISPYSGLGSTRFISGSYALATYSSATDRLINTTGNHGMSDLNFIPYKLDMHGWFYPRSTGSICALVERESEPDYGRLEFYVNSSNNIAVSRYADGALVWTVVGDSCTLNQWNWKGFSVYLGDYPMVGTTGTARAEVYGVTGYEASETVIAKNAAFKYLGGTGDSYSSTIKFGGSDINLCDWAIRVLPTGYVQSDFSYYSGEKGGRFQALIEGTGILSGLECSSFSSATFDLPITTTPATRSIYIAAHNAYDNDPKLNGGFLLYPDIPFKETQAYHLKYNTSSISQAFGDTDSPIRIGYTVPDNAINIARVDSPEFTVEASVSTINLSYTNVNNISVIKDGEYTTSRNGGSISSSTITGNYKGVTTVSTSGRADIKFLGAANSDNIELTTLSITDPDLTYPEEAYYTYLLGRGINGVKVTNADPHYTGELLETATGTYVDTYRNNLTRIKNLIVLKNSEGKELSIEEFPFDIVYSNRNPIDLQTAAYTGIGINVDGIGPTSGRYSPYLPDTVFSVVLLCGSKTLNNNTSVWVHYPSYRYSDGLIDPYHKEIVNPIPIYRENQNYEIPDIGRFSLSRNQLDSKSYDITVYGIASGYSGAL